jgi:hypothetical protein
MAAQRRLGLASAIQYAFFAAGAMQVKTRVKAWGLNANHNETLVRTVKAATSLKVKTGLKAGSVLLPTVNLPNQPGASAS